jgi:WD40 repeat protein
LKASVRFFPFREATPDTVFAIAFAPDGKALASGGCDVDNYTVRLWEVSTGKEIRILKGYQGNVFSVAYSSDGKTVASGGEDSMVHLWEIATGKEIRTQQMGTKDMSLEAQSK